jgi:hypothetical protein
MNRRNFLRKTALFTGALLVAPALPTLPAASGGMLLGSGEFSTLLEGGVIEAAAPGAALATTSVFSNALQGLAAYEAISYERILEFTQDIQSLVETFEQTTVTFEEAESEL